MGWRALRLSLEREGLMKAQARALLEAAAGLDDEIHRSGDRDPAGRRGEGATGDRREIAGGAVAIAKIHVAAAPAPGLSRKRLIDAEKR